MSIELENPKTVIEKIDAAANFVEQMYLSKMVGDELTFKKAHEKAGKLLFDVKLQIEERES